MQFLRDLTGWGASAPKLNPAFQYLRATLGGSKLYLALGEIDALDGKRVEVWYSSERAVLRLVEGRLAGVVGMTAEWRNVSQPGAPSWAEAARAAEPLHWIRVRDVMPGYQYGVRDALTLRRIAPPAGSALLNVAPDTLVWFEETVEGGVLPPARYAVESTGERTVVVYGEQCLSASSCIRWQRWSADQPVQ